MLINHQPYDNAIFYVNDQPIKRLIKTNKFKYLGSIFVITTSEIAMKKLRYEQ